MFENKSKSPEDVLRRLEELRRWQEEQQRILIEKQNSQRQLLGKEQREMYAKLGFSSPSINAGVHIVAECDKSKIMDENSFNSCNLSGITRTEDTPNSCQETPAKSGAHGTGPLNRESAILSDKKQVEKKPFLRKGQGLSTRFKVDPNNYRLHNLPKYKFANSHRKFIQQPEKLPVKKPDFKKLVLQKPKPVTEVLPTQASELKPRKYVASQEATLKLPKVDFSLKNHEQEKDNVTKDSLISASDKLDGSEPISWADVFNPNNIKPISIESLRKHIENADNSYDDDDLENLSLFELLEKKAEDGSILLDSSILQRWVKTTRKPETDEVEQQSLIDMRSVQKARVSPLPCDIRNKIIIDDSDAVTTSSDDEDSAAYKPEKCRVRFSDEIIVNQLDTDDSEAETETVLSQEMVSIDTSKISTPNEKFDYETIRAQLFAESTTLTDGDLSNTITTNSSINNKQSELVEKTDLLKSRLADLEKEIAEFQAHNSQLIKLKQEVQLEKIRIDQEQIECNEKLENERIKIEIQLHDERMKIEDEKKKYEKLIRDHRTLNRKEREEITKLKEKVEHLQNENRDKDSKHTGAQARLRTQMRNMEKDLKEFSFEIDHLKKEKKRLESENAKLIRNNNSKMLQEINKSIAKLVPKPVPTVTEVKNRNPKPAVARVTSHTSGVSYQPSKSKFVRSTPQEEPINCDSSTHDDESSCDEAEEERSAYFKSKRKSGKKEDDDESQDEADRPNDNEISASNNSGFSTKDDFKREIQNSDGSKDIWYSNGNLKKISADGMIIRMLYYNKDIKETNINEGTVKYYYAETNTWHTTYLDGLEILEFPNGQTEHRYKDGTIEVHFENGSIRISNPTDPVKTEEWRYPDGTNLIQLKSGDKILSMPNGQKEIHTKIHKRREYPDGTVKIVYPDGSQETRYSNGRIRLKDKDGNLVMDSEQI